MFIASFFSWWYTKGWIGVANSFESRLISVANTFSVNQLLRTLFAPWRRIISYPGAKFDDKLRAAFDNLFSRSIGLIVRLLVLFTALIFAFLITIVTAIEFILWPILPFAFIILLVVGVIW